MVQILAHMYLTVHMHPSIAQIAPDPPFPVKVFFVAWFQSHCKIESATQNQGNVSESTQSEHSQHVSVHAMQKRIHA